MQRKNRIGLLIAIIVSVVAISIFLISKYMPNFDKTSFRDAMSLGNEKIYFMLEDKVLLDVSSPVMEDSGLYIPVDFIKEYLDPYIFWDSKADRLSITTDNKVIRMSTEKLEYYVNNKPMSLNLPVHKIDGQAYMPYDFVKTLYNVTIDYSENTKLALVNLNEQPTITATVATKKATTRFAPDIKSPIIKELTDGETVTLFESIDPTSKFTKIRTSDGALGYIHTKDIFLETKIPVPLKTVEPKIVPENNFDDKLVLLWDLITTADANSNPNRRIKHKGVDVLSPTWFSFDADKLNGDIINIADKGYVDWAHESGYQVWALISDNFNRELNHAILSDTAVREYVIKQLLALSSLYNLDGINIDFEALAKDDAPYYLQFIRELAPLLHEQGVVLSVDMFVPIYTKYYNRTEIGKAVDYICVMTYDEHYSGSETSGPVASLPFVDEGIAATLTEVPKEKILMGLPFYVRIWREEVVDGKTVHTIKNTGMKTAYDTFIEKGASFEWLADIGSYYGEYKATEEGKEITYRVWLEDIDSIKEKLKVATTHDVKGIAGWERGLEREELWDEISRWKETK